MSFNKVEFNKILGSTILRKYRSQMTSFQWYSRSDSKDQGQTPYYEYGIKWETGDIGIRIFLNENFARVLCHIGHISDFVDIDYYDGDDFVENNKTLIKQLIEDAKLKCLASDKNYVW